MLTGGPGAVSPSAPWTRSRTGRRPRLALACVAVVALAACGSGDDTATRPISVSDVWALATVTGQPNGAVYFTVMSTADDTLEQVKVPDTVADQLRCTSR